MLAQMIVLLALLLAAAPAPRAQRILARSLQARGGAARFAALRTLVERSELIFAQGQRWQVRTWIKAPDRIRIEIHTPKGTMVQGFDGHTAWQIDPGAKMAHALNGAAANQVRDEGEQGFDMAIAPESRGIAIAYAGAGTMDGRRYEAVRFTFPSGDTFVQFFDAQSGLQFFEQYPLPQGRHGSEAVRDYRRVKGLLFPSAYVNLPGPTLKILEWRLDVPLDDALFAPPIRR